MASKSNGLLDGKRIAEIGVSIAVQRLLKCGYQVALPIIDDGYDLLAFEGRTFWRIQVKATAAYGQNRRRIRITRGAKKRTRYRPDQVDAFIVVNVTSEVAMCVPLSDVKGRSWINWSQMHSYTDFDELRRCRPSKN